MKCQKLHSFWQKIHNFCQKVHVIKHVIDCTKLLEHVLFCHFSFFLNYLNVSCTSF